MHGRWGLDCSPCFPIAGEDLAARPDRSYLFALGTGRSSPRCYAELPERSPRLAGGDCCSRPPPHYVGLLAPTASMCAWIKRQILPLDVTRDEKEVDLELLRPEAGARSVWFP